ncbi:gamma-interferon-inducible lysosomal thiol reductase [Gouania willdenowi]|uniref:Gamma-interferon-inducible lysosomal thiol reductase n=1 Tax=Gouania willdenowi TaxID=441366 RepID=A0A8C5GQK6_GOUWI|nr:gamma-interferon-inducible lysosomal thiol reductase-like [Gouania willdenowi]
MMKAVLLLLLSLTVCVSSDPGSSCVYPPFSWCSSVDSAVRCGVLKQCLQSNFTRSRQTADKVQVELYYESLCPGCRLFITGQLFPTWLMLQDIMEVTLVPYGNAMETFDGKKYIYKCQHGPQECLGNMLETCLLNMTNAAAFHIINCMESATDVIQAAKSCVSLYSPELDFNSLMTCVNGDQGNQLMHQNALKTRALDPPHKSVPWVVVDGVHIDDSALSAFFKLVCDHYKGSPPPACGGRQRAYNTYCHKD